MSGLTAQPNLGSIAAALVGTERDPGVSAEHLQTLSTYWEGVRRYYQPFEANIRSGTSDVYRHEMPGGQYTNLREQARALGLASRWARSRSRMSTRPGRANQVGSNTVTL